MAEVDLKAEVERFAKVAREYCGLIDRFEEYSRVEFLRRARIALAELVIAGAKLPDVEVDWEDSQSAGPGRDEWRALFKKLGQGLGTLDMYWFVFDPKKEDEAIQGMISDDLSDIWCDLRKGLEMEQLGRSPAEVIFTWKILFDSHWGHHAVSALAAIQALLADE